MFELKDISKKELLDKYGNTQFGYICRTSDVKNAEDIYKIYETYTGKDKYRLDRDFAEIRRRMSHVNAVGSTPEKYFPDEYSSDDLSYNDRWNYGDILFLDCPTAAAPIKKYNDVKREKIMDIKDDLKHTAVNGHNYARHWYEGIGKSNMPTILNSVNMFTAQIERQAKLTDRRDINLFDFDYREREKIVLSHIRDILIWLMQHQTDGFVWGEVSEHKKMLYFSAINEERMRDEIIRVRVSRYVASYVTLEEAKDIETGKVLGRFLK